MNKYSSILIAILSCTVLNARPNIPPRNDLQKLNLKGPVTQVVEYQCDFKENFGEWIVSGRKDRCYYLFNEHGLFLLNAEINKDERLYFKVYRYGQKGISQVITFVTHDSDDFKFTADNIGDYYSSSLSTIDKCNPRISVYDYSEDGTLKSITNRWYNGTITSKELYRYTDDGYETIFYRGDGTKDTDLVYVVSQNGRMISEVTSEGFVVVSKYDDNYRLVEASASYRAYNGAMSSVTCYKYNNNGDVLAYVSGTGAQKSIEGLESVYPYFKNEYRDSDSRFYEYEYDSYGNWIVKKEFGFRGSEAVVKKWWEREITYSGSGDSIIEGYEKQVELLRLEEERKKAEHEAWLARPDLAQPSDSLIQFMKPLFNYPDASNKALTSILSKSGSWLRLIIPVFITKEGDTCFPNKHERYDSTKYDYYDAIQWNLNNQKFYLLETTALKEEAQAAKEIGKIIDELLPKLKDAPKAIPGKKGSRFEMNVYFAGGRIGIQDNVYLKEWY